MKTTPDDFLVCRRGLLSTALRSVSFLASSWLLSDRMVRAVTSPDGDQVAGQGRKGQGREGRGGAGQGRGGRAPDQQTRGGTANRQKVYGLLVGSAIGDAVGGPVEFKKPNETESLLLGCRNWSDDRQFSTEDLRAWSESLPLLSYDLLRPKPEPYGQWQTAAVPGTITDDTRHKMVLLNALRAAGDAKAFPVTRRSLATAYLGFEDSLPANQSAVYKPLCDEGHREFVRASRWVLGGRTTPAALPPDRLWGGLATCCGQMLLLPLAAIYGDDPSAAYRAAFAIGFVDNGEAKDLNSAIVAGLSKAIGTEVKPGLSRQAWDSVIEAMRQTDPFSYNDVPFVERPTIRWLRFAKDAASRSEKRPKRLYEIMENEGKPHFFWEAHFTFVVTFSMLHFCDWDPLAAMHLALDFGHDTDSTTQLLGAFAGALHGPAIFPDRFRQKVEKRLVADYGQSLQEWTDLLVELSDREKYPEVVALDS